MAAGKEDHLKAREDTAFSAFFKLKLITWLALWIYKLLSSLFFISYSQWPLWASVIIPVSFYRVVYWNRKFNSCLRLCSWFIAQRNLNSCPLSRTPHSRLSAYEIHNFSFLPTSWDGVDFQKATFQKKQVEQACSSAPSFKLWRSTR